MTAAQFKVASERVQVEIRATEAEIGRRSAGSALAGSPTSPTRCARSGRSRASTGAARTDRRAAEHVHVGAGVSRQRDSDEQSVSPNIEGGSTELIDHQITGVTTKATARHRQEAIARGNVGRCPFAGCGGSRI